MHDKQLIAESATWPLPTAGSKATPVIVPTGVNAVDKLLGGGTVASHLYALLGPTGSGRTTLATSIAAEGAVAAFVRGANSGSWVYITIGEKDDEIRRMAISSAARISRNTLCNVSDADELSRLDSLRPYEILRRSEFPPLLREVHCESHRYFIVNAALNCHFAVVDLSWARFADHKSLGNLVRDSAHRQLRLQRLPNRICGVVLDSPYTLAQMYVFAQRDRAKADPKRISGVISDLLLDLKQAFAVRHGCPVWVVHTIASAKMDVPPTATLTHFDASDCRAFGRRIDGCIVLGNRVPGTGMRVARCTKSPILLPNPEPIVVRVDQDFATLAEAKGYACDRRRGGIIESGGPAIIMDAVAIAAVHELAAKPPITLKKRPSTRAKKGKKSHVGTLVKSDAYVD